MNADFHRNNATIMLVNLICGFITDDELKSGKYDRFGDRNVLQNDVARRSTDNRNEMMAICCDIVDDLFKLEEHDIKIT